MKVILLLVIISVVFAVDVRRQFTDFQREFGRSYKTEKEFNHRFNIFQRNLERNEELSRANPLATFGINKFSDLSEEEFAEQYLMVVDSSQYVKPSPLDLSAERSENVRACKPDPKDYDWTTCGAVTPVYNQGDCGSCWAFSAVETIESYFFLQGGPLVQLSVEQVLDCDNTSYACEGGWPASAYEYVAGAGGIETASDYPYISGNGEGANCTFEIDEVVATLDNFTSIDGETGIYEQVSSSSGGPVSVCLNATTWQTYTGGIITSCYGGEPDHCVQVIGYAHYGTKHAYWIVRNSWGTEWGMEGMIHIEIGNDLCAIGDYATIPTGVVKA